MVWKPKGKMGFLFIPCIICCMGLQSFTAISSNSIPDPPSSIDFPKESIFIPSKKTSDGNSFASASHLNPKMNEADQEKETTSEFSIKVELLNCQAWQKCKPILKSSSPSKVRITVPW
jgi:hypothetical protein